MLYRKIYIVIYIYKTFSKSHRLVVSAFFKTQVILKILIYHDILFLFYFVESVNSILALKGTFIFM